MRTACAISARVACEGKAKKDRSRRKRSMPTPRTTIEAILWCVRQRGVQALHEPENIERLLRCDSAAKSEINGRIARKIAASGDKREGGK
jgi:hypothetical protein